MRVKRWTLPSRAKPPDQPQSTSRRPHPPPRPPRPQPLSKPPSILEARKNARQRAQRGGVWDHPVSQAQDSPYFLNSTLSHLPPISAPPRLNLRPLPDLEHQLSLWRKACSIAHTALSRRGPLAGSKELHLVQHKVAKVVGHTMRILLQLGQVDAAKELDRAFFSKESGRKRGKRRATEGELAAAAAEKQQGGEAVHEGQEEERLFVERWAQRDGLGLPRGEIRLAWMSSFAVRLDEAVQGEDDAALLEFGSLLKLMYGQLGEQQARGDACLMAFLTRKMGVVQEQLAARRTRDGDGVGSGEGEEGEALEETKEQVRRLLLNIKDAEADEVEVVSFALLETALQRLERVKGNALEDPLFSKVEEDIQHLVGSLDANTEFRALHNLLLTFTSSVDRHAHILHLAIRFLLLRHRYHDPSHPSSSSSPSPLQSATQLYSLLLDLTPRLPSPPTYTALSSLRQRQSSALYRLLAAYSSSAASSPPALLHSLATQALDLIDLSLSSLRTLSSALSSSPPLDPPPLPANTPPPPSPLLLGISTRLFRRLLFTLTSSLPPTLPSDVHPTGIEPHGTHVHGRYVPVVGWGVVERALRTVVRAKEYDAPLSSASSSLVTGAGGKDEAQEEREALLEHEKPLFQQPNFAHQLVRAALLGAGEGEGGAESTPLSRLSTLLNFVADLERVSPPFASPPTPSPSSASSAAPPLGTGLGERRARLLFLSATRTIVHSEWRGSAALEWRKEVVEAVEGWAREGRDWEWVRGEVRGREEGKGRRREERVRKEKEKGTEWRVGRKRVRKGQAQASSPSARASTASASKSPSTSAKPAPSASSALARTTSAKPPPPSSTSASSPPRSSPPTPQPRAIRRRGKPAFFTPSSIPASTSS